MRKKFLLTLKGLLQNSRYIQDMGSRSRQSHPRLYISSILQQPPLFVKQLSDLFAIEKDFDKEQCAQHQDNAYRKRDPCGLHESGNDVSHKGHGRCGNCIRKLGGNMVYMVTLPPGGRHDGGI